MNVKKIEYVEDCRTIQCLVDVVLPDTVRIDGQSTWEGMFYFGLDRNGLIETHIFDRKITNYMGKPIVSNSGMNYPWLQAAPGQMAQMPMPQYAANQHMDMDINLNINIHNNDNDNDNEQIEE